MIPDERLEVMDIAVGGPVGGVVGDDLGFFPDTLEIILWHGTAQTLRAEGGGGIEPVGGMGTTDRQHVAEVVEPDLGFDGEDEIAGHLVPGKGPADLAVADAGDDLFLGVDQFRLFVAEIEGIPHPEARHAAPAVEGRDKSVLPDGQLRQHDRKVDIARPVEDTGRMREGKVIGGQMAARAGERHLDVQAGGGIPVEEDALFLAIRFVKDDEATGHTADLGGTGRG